MGGVHLPENLCGNSALQIFTSNYWLVKVANTHANTKYLTQSALKRCHVIDRADNREIFQIALRLVDRVLRLHVGVAWKSAIEVAIDGTELAGPGRLEICFELLVCFPSWQWVSLVVKLKRNHQ